MSHSSYESMSGGYMSTDSDSSTSSPENQKVLLRTPNPSSILMGASHDSTHVKPGLDTLPCPVPGCSSVFKGKIRHGYLWRHLGRPGLYGLTGDEKAAWENLHKIERDRLLAARITPAHRKREANNGRVQRKLRTAEFELRALNMGITKKALIAQKVAIWEGMWTAEQNGEDIKYDAWVLLDFCTST